jgi:hypothetical protein
VLVLTDNRAEVQELGGGLRSEPRAHIAAGPRARAAAADPVERIAQIRLEPKRS